MFKLDFTTTKYYIALFIQTEKKIYAILFFQLIYFWVYIDIIIEDTVNTVLKHYILYVWNFYSCQLALCKHIIQIRRIFVQHFQYIYNITISLLCFLFISCVVSTYNVFFFNCKTFIFLYNFYETFMTKIYTFILK